MLKKQHILGIDIGGTKCAIVSGSLSDDNPIGITGENDLPAKDGQAVARTGQIEIISKSVFLTETAKGCEQTIENIYTHIDAELAKTGLTIGDIAAIGVSCGGPLDSKKGLIMSPPNLPGWDNIPIVELVEKRYGVKTAVQNDANACTLAEWKYGAGKGFNNVIFLTFGTGMGSGLVLDGRLYAGTNDMAGEVGHIRLENTGPVGYGKAGSFEGFCSGGGIAQLARTLSLEKLQMGEPVAFCSSMAGLDAIDAKVVAEAAFQGDSLAIEIYRICGTYLGKALSTIIDILNPEVIVLGSIYGRSQTLIEPAMRSVIERETLSHSRNVCRIVPAGLGESIGDYAALSVATYLM
jgi:glucokinase